MKVIIRYVIRKYKSGVYISEGISYGKLTYTVMQERPDKNKSKYYEIDVFIWKDKSKEVLENKRHVKEDKRKRFTLNIEQFSPYLNTNLEVTSGYEEVEASQDGIKILGIT